MSSHVNLNSWYVAVSVAARVFDSPDITLQWSVLIHHLILTSSFVPEKHSIEFDGRFLTLTC